MTLKINQLSCQIGSTNILSELNLSLNKGDIVCLLGASGCGKTTVLKAISGLLPLSEGSVELEDRLLSSSTVMIPPEKRNIGMIFQDYALFPHLNVAENILFGLSGLTKVDKQIALEHVLSLVNLNGFGKRFPSQLSGGQQQRVAIARALAPKPDLLLMDEPFSNIDQQLKLEMIDEIRKILKAEGVTTIFVTHNKDEAFAFADQIAVMEGGKIIQQGSAKKLYHKPANRFIAEALGKTNSFDGEIVDGKIRLNDAVINVSELTQEQKQQLSLYQDGPIKLLIRPQYLQVFPSNNSHLQVSRRVFLGDNEYIEVTDGRHAYMVSAKGTKVVEGDAVHLDVLPHPLVMV